MKLLLIFQFHLVPLAFSLIFGRLFDLIFIMSTVVEKWLNFIYFIFSLLIVWIFYLILMITLLMTSVIINLFLFSKFSKWQILKTKFELIIFTITGFTSGKNKVKPVVLINHSCTFFVLQRRWVLELCIFSINHGWCELQEMYWFKYRMCYKRHCS